MQQPPDPPINQRLRTVRRRITAAVLATFVAAWLAVAAFGKGGDAGTTAATTTPSSSGTSSQTDDSSNSTQSSDDFGSSQSTQSDPVTSSQS
jgi:hypothetical protein